MSNYSSNDKGLFHTAIVRFALGAVRVNGKGGNDMKARQASESDEDGHSGFEEHADEIVDFGVAG